MLTTTRKQRDEIRRQYPGVILLMQIADTYHAYEDDAATVAAVGGDLVTVEPGRVTIDEWDLATVNTALINAGYRVGVCTEAP